MKITIAHLSPDRKSILRLGRMTEEELAKANAADPLKLRLVVPVTTPSPRPIGTACDVRMTIREDDVLREYLPKPALLREQLRSRIPERRWQIQTGGIRVGGVKIQTDDRASLALTRLALRAETDPEFTTRLKTVEGWMAANADQLMALSTAVDHHIARAFQREEELAVQLDAASDGDLPALVHVVEAFWPAN